MHTTLLNYLQAFQRNEDPGQDLIRDPRSTPLDPLNGDTFTNGHSPSAISTNEPHSILFEPIDFSYGWPPVDVPPFSFNLANANAPLQTNTAAAGEGDTLLGQDMHPAPSGLSHDAALSVAEENSDGFQQFFADQMAALGNSGPDQGWESFLSS